MIDLKKYTGLKKAHDQELLKQLLERKFTVKIFEKEISYRTINYWDEKGFLLTEREKADTDWRKLSFIDYIWIRLLDEVRKMGMSVELFVKNLFRELGIKTEVLEELSNKQYDNLKSLDIEKLVVKIDKDLVTIRIALMLATIISYKSPLSIRLYSTGEIIEKYGNPKYIGFRIESNEDSESEKILKEFGKNYISISISSLIADFIETKDLNNIETLSLLNQEEIELLKHVRNKDLKEISIVLQDGAPIKLELSEISYNADINKRIYEDMIGQDYIECTYTTNGKKQVTFKRTIKVKLK